MAGPLAAIERFFERIFERPAVLLFRTRLQPVQLQRRLERAMESEQRHGADRTYVPNRYRVRLHPDDLGAFRSYQHSLEEEVAEALLARAHARGYTLLERPRVTLHGDGSVPRGEVAIESEVLDPLHVRPAPPGFRRVTDEEVDAGQETDGVPDGESGGRRVDRTAVFAVPRVETPRISIVVRSPGRAPQRLTLAGGSASVGRASDNEIVLVDERVSRYHGRLVSRQGTLVFTDLGSTNGSYLGGARVSEIALGPGDVVQLGESSLTVEPDR
jgi:hypothetical protein